jgi:enterochelin esterase family protein
VVDGRYELDPANPLIEPNLYYLNSSFVVPSATPQPWDEQEVPHGVVHRHRYTTRIAQGFPDNHSEFYVYTPPGYDAGSKEPYPVLYLLHGFSQLASTWVDQGHADHILDNLIAQGKARPMVVVMPYGYGDMEILKGYKEHAARNDALFESALTQEVIPQVESAYHVSRRHEDRAIAGLSMGGDQSMRIGLAHPELFGWVACMSGASDFVKEAVDHGDYDAAKTGLRLLWVGSGTGETEGLPKTHALMAALRARGFTVTGLDAPGMHTWMVWHPDLVDIAPRLFR